MEIPCCIKKLKLNMTHQLMNKMVVTYFENDIDFGVFKDNVVIKDEELVSFLKVFFRLHVN